MNKAISFSLALLLTTAVAAPAYAQRGGGGGHFGGGGGMGAGIGHMGGGGHAGGIGGGIHMGGMGGPGRAVPMGVPHRGMPPHGPFVAGRAFPGAVHAGPFVHGHAYGYGHPFYPAFRPHVSLGFGLWLGYPYYYFGYPFYYGSPYGYPYNSYYSYPSYPSSYGYVPHGYSTSGESAPPVTSGTTSGGVTAATSSSGALTFDVTPSNAEVWIDGNRAGTVGDFAPSGKPLELPPGRHTVDIRLEGYRTVTFDADVLAGEVLPYRGTMERE